MEESLLTSGLSATEIENLRQQNPPTIAAGAVSTDLSLAMELSKREEEARLKRLRDEEEELEKVSSQDFSLHPVDSRQVVYRVNR